MRKPRHIGGRQGCGSWNKSGLWHPSIRRMWTVVEASNEPGQSLCAFCRVVVPTKPFTNTASYYKMLFESGPTPLATKCFGGFDGGSKANVGHYKMHLRNHFVVENGLQ